GRDTIVTSHYGPPGEKTVLPCASRLYVEYQLGGPSAIRAFTLDGKPAPPPKQPEIASVRGMVPFQGDDILFSAGPFLEPSPRHPLARRLVRRPVRPLPASGRQGRRDGQAAAVVAAGRRVRRHHRRPGVRHEQGRDEGAGEHPRPEGGEARRVQPVPGDRLRRV